MATKTKVFQLNESEIRDVIIQNIRSTMKHDIQIKTAMFLFESNNDGCKVAITYKKIKNK